MVEVGGDCWKYLVQPLAQNNQLEQIALNIVQLGSLQSSLSKGGDYNVSWQPVPVLDHAHGKKVVLLCLNNCELIHTFLFFSSFKFDACICFYKKEEIMGWITQVLQWVN